MKRAALYMRVSTVDQHPECRLHDLRQMAAQRNLEIVQEYTDRISGVKAKRPGLDQMMTDARHGRFDVVLTWACDRIARSTRHLLEPLDELNRLGAASSRCIVAACDALLADFVTHDSQRCLIGIAGIGVVDFSLRLVELRLADLDDAAQADLVARRRQIERKVGLIE